MSTLKLKGSTSGYVELTAPATAGDNQIVLPTTAGTVAVKDASNNTEVGTGVTIGSPSSNVFTVSTNGSERVRVSAAGSFSIGQSVPDERLHITGASSSNTTVKVQSTAFAAERSSIEFFNNAISRGRVGGANDFDGLTIDSSSTESTAAIRFRTGGGTLTEKARILPGGGLTFNGDTAAANALDDYEEGSWTPDLGGITGETYSGQEGYYVKIGTLCLASGRISLSNKGSASSEITISLPFAKGPTDGRRVVANIQWENMTTAVSNVYGLIYLSQAISVYRSSTNTTSSSFLYHADLANNTVLHFSVVYHTA